MKALPFKNQKYDIIKIEPKATPDDVIDVEFEINPVEDSSLYSINHHKLSYDEIEYINKWLGK